MNTLQAIQSQYLSALEMLKQVIVQCPEQLWGAPGDEDSCWHRCYHALYYTHLYLQVCEDDFQPWHKQHKPDQYSYYYQSEVLEYLGFVQQQVKLLVPSLNLEATSGFDWLPFNKFELQLYNIRHIQQHAGEMFERIGSKAELEFYWVSRTPDYLK